MLSIETSGFGQSEGDRGLRPPDVALGRRLGIGTTGELVGSWHKKLRFHYFIHHHPHGYKCSLFIGLNYSLTEFVTMPLNCYSTFLEYSATGLLFVGQSCHTVSK